MQRWPESQSREVTQAVWQRWNAHTKGESQSELIEQPAASLAVWVLVESEQAEETSRPTMTKSSDLSRFPILPKENR